MKRRLFISIFLLAWVILVGTGYLLSKPSLISIYPSDEQAMIAANTPLRLEFSHRMNDEITSGGLKIVPDVEGAFHWEDTTLVFTPRDGWPSRTTIQVQLEPGQRTAPWPWLPITPGMSWSFTVRQPLLLYLYPVGEPANIYILDISVNERWALTQFPNGVLEFDVDTIRGLIYYSRENGLGGVDIYRQPLHIPNEPVTPTPAAQDETQVTFCGSAECRAPRISPRGDFLAYERASLDPASGSGLIQVWVAPLDQIGENSETFLPAAVDHQTLHAAWSKNGWLAFYNSTRRAHVLLNPSSGVSIDLPNETGQPGIWTSDGSAFLTTEAAVSEDQTTLPSGVEARVNRRILMYTLVSGQSRDLTGSARMDDAFPSPSADGRWLAFARRDLDLAQWVPGRQIWLMEITTGESHPLTSIATSDHYDFAWTPDSAELAFVRSDQAELVSPPEIWVLDTRFGFASKVVSGGFAPVWIP